MVDKNKEEIKSIQQAGLQKPITLQNLQYFYLHGIKSAFVNALRAAFSDESIPEEYRYIPNSEQSQISIFKNYPQRLQKLPCLIVTTGSGDGSFSYVGDEILFETEDNENGFVYGGYMTMDVSVNILAGNIKDMERLTDLVLILMRFVFRQKFQEENIAYNKLKIAGEESDDESVGRVYKNTISTTVTCDFDNVVPHSLIEKIKNIDISLSGYEE